MAQAGEATAPLLEAISPSPRRHSHFVLDLGRRNNSCFLSEGLQRSADHHSKVQRKLIFALVLCFVFMIVEVVGGFIAHSLAIMADAAHLLADVSGFAVSVFAGVYAARKSHTSFSYGYHRVEVLGALASVLTVWLVTGVLVFEAVDRVVTPVYVNGKVMTFLGLAAVGVNVVLFFTLGHHGHGHGHSHSHSEGPSPCASAQAIAAPELDASTHANDDGHSHGHNHSDSHSHSHEHAHDHDHEHGHEHDQECGHGRSHDHKHGTSTGVSAFAAAANGPAHTHSNGHEHDHGHNHGHGHSHGHDHNLNLQGAVLHVIGDLVQSIGVVIAGLLIWYNQDDPRWYIADPICTFFFAVLVLYTTATILRDISDVLMERTPRHVDPEAIATEIAKIEGVTGLHDLHVWSLTPGIPLLAAHVNIANGADATVVLSSLTAYTRSLGITHTTFQLVAAGNHCPCPCVTTIAGAVECREPQPGQ